MIEIGPVEDLYRKAFKVWGEYRQLLKTVEEAGELQKAIARYMIPLYDEDLGSWDKGELITELMEEVVDVEIMIGQIKIAFARHGGLYDLCRFEKVENLRRLLALEEGPP